MTNLFKSALVLGGLATSIASFGESGNFYKVLPIEGPVMNISDNGQYVISCLGMEINFLYDDATGNSTVLDANGAPYCIAYDVSDNGKVVGHVNDLPAYYENNEWHYLDIPEGYSGGLCSGVSADGSKIYGVVSAGFFFSPVIWTNGVAEFVEVLEKDIFNKVPEGGFMIDQFSMEGELMAGRVIDHNYRWYPVLWKNGVPQYINPDFFKEASGKPNKYEMEVHCFSPNSRYLALNIIEESTATASLEYTPVIYNIEEDVMTVLESELMMFIDNKGRGYTSAPQNILIRTGYIHVGDVTYSLEDWALNNYGVDMIGESGIEYSGTPTAIAKDGVTIVGFATDGENDRNYMMRLSEPLPNSIQKQHVSKPVVYSSQSNIIISSPLDANVSIYDITGVALKQFEMKAGSESVSFTTGTYIVRIQQGSEIYSYKTIINF